MTQPDQKVFYLAGPMTGIEDYNFPLFNRVVKTLRDRGMCIVSSHEVDHLEDDETRGTTKSHGEYVRLDLRYLLDCDAIIFLPGWTRSKGALVEFQTAVGCGMEIYLFDDHATLRNNLIRIT